MSGQDDARCIKSRNDDRDDPIPASVFGVKKSCHVFIELPALTCFQLH